MGKACLVRSLCSTSTRAGFLVHWHEFVLGGLIQHSEPWRLGEVSGGLESHRRTAYFGQRG
jgi:hypothetical protein